MRLLTTCFYIVLTTKCLITDPMPPCQHRVWVCPYRGVAKFPGRPAPTVLEKQPQPPLPQYGNP